MKGYIIAYFVIVALMLIFARTLYEWEGVWVVEGILAGIAFWVSDEIWTRQKAKKKNKK